MSFEFCEIIRNSVVLNGVNCLISSKWLQKETSEKLWSWVLGPQSSGLET